MTVDGPPEIYVTPPVEMGRPSDWQGQSYFVSIPNSRPTFFILAGKDWQVRISMQDGSIEYSGNYQPNAAARQFWDAISQEYRDMLKWKVEQGTEGKP